MQLESNLNAIVASGKNAPVTSPFGTALHHPKSFLGSAYRLMYSAGTLFSRIPHRENKLQRALELTNESYIKCCQDTEKALLEFKGILQCPGAKIDELRLQKIKEKIRYWHGAISPVLKTLQKQSQDYPIPSFDKEQVPVEMLNLEFQTLMDLPIGTLLKLSKREELSVIEAATIDGWIENLERWSERGMVDFRTLHHGIKQMLALMLDLKGENLTHSLIDLENELSVGGMYRRPLRTFKKEDPSYVKWRSTLVLTKKIPNTDYEIDQVLSRLKSRRIKTYSIKSQPNKILMVGDNEAQLGIKLGKLKHSLWGMQSVQMQIDSEFGFAIVELPNVALEGIQWNELQEKRKMLLMVALAAHLEWFAKQNLSPKGMKTSNVYMDDKYLLRTFKPFSAEEFFDLMNIEKFCRDFANGDDTLFYLMMELSKITKHQAAVFFREVVKHAWLKEAKWDQIKNNINLPEEIDHLEYIDQAAKLFQQAVEILKALEDFPVKRSEIAKSCWEVYLATNCVTTFSTRFADEVLDKIQGKSKNLDKKEVAKYLDVMKKAVKIEENNKL